MRVGLEHLLENFLRVTVPERVLIAHGAVEPSLRDLVARGREVDGAEPLVGFFLTECRLRERKASRKRCAHGERML